MAITELVVLMIIGLNAVSARVEPNISTWQDNCCEPYCPNVTALVGDSADNRTRYPLICQLGDNSNTEKKALYATFFDSVKKIPVFSRFSIHNSGNEGRKEFWQEADLAWPLDGHIYSYTTLVNNLTNINVTDPDDRIQSSQAVHGDYSPYYPEYHRGHLNYHRAFRFSPLAVSSTFTYTNVFPQVGKFNSGVWNRVEYTLSAYVRDPQHMNIAVVGATPSNDSVLNERVNVPSFLWAYVHYNETISAILSPNINNAVIKQNCSITQLYLYEDKLNSLLSALNELFNTPRLDMNIIDNNIAEFRREVMAFALPPDQNDIFYQQLACIPWEDQNATNVRMCIGNQP